MDNRNLKRLEFDKVKEKLTEYAGSEPGRELIAGLMPMQDRDAIIAALAEVTEGRELLRLEPTARLGGWNDVRDEARRCRRGGMLDGEELWHVAQTLTAARQMKAFFNERRETYLRLGEIAQGLGDYKELEKNIIAAVLPGGEISDRATERLFNIRRKMASAQLRVKERLDAIIRSTSYQKYLQDPIVTMREGRYVVPVKLEYRGQVPGIVHDQSASGATLFIEPMPVVEANNEVRTLMAEEKQEVERIIRELSTKIGARAEDLLYTLEVLGRIDFIMAKARYSASLDAWVPGIITEPRLNIKHGKHPLLPGKAVPTSMHLGFDFDTLVITGPNTGGKTVTLKTAGLLVAMAHSGLHVPADDGTVIGMFDQVFVDIGDEQSIEQSLSTFSSHMTNIVDLLGKVTSKSLVLLDELGAGTDPTEGSALAQAILDNLRLHGAKTVATTHYGELKHYAYTHDRVENASVEFDPETLRPTYRLLIGRPGRSNAFEIALRLGLAKAVIEQARGFLSEEQVKMADLMTELEKARTHAEKEKLEAEKLRSAAEQYKEQYLTQLNKIQTTRDEVMARAVAESRDLIKKSKREVESLMEELRSSLKEDSLRDKEHSITKARQRLKQIQQKSDALEPEDDLRENVQAITEVKPGDEIFLPKYGQQGIVLEVSGNDVHVQIGIIRMTVNRKELARATGKKKDRPSPSPGPVNLAQQKVRDISTKLDMRGMRVEEALAELDKYLDDASLAGLPVVYLVHGKGTGALRSAVQEVLKLHPGVKTYRLGEQGEGGSGVTVAYF